jgi:hypothetical protein
MLSAPIARQGLETVRRRYAQIIEIPRMMQHVQFPQRLFFQAAEALYKRAHPQGFSGAIAKRPDHTMIYFFWRYTSSV